MKKSANIMAVEKQIITMREEGKTRREIANELGFTKAQIKNWVGRYNRRSTKLESGQYPKKRGRPPKDTKSISKDDTIKQLSMENQLLRDFLHAAGRR